MLLPISSIDNECLKKVSIAERNKAKFTITDGLQQQKRDGTIITAELFLPTCLINPIG